MRNTGHFSTGLLPENGSYPLVNRFCSAMKINGQRERANAHPCPQHNQSYEDRNMHLDSDTQIPPSLQDFLPIGVLADAFAKDCIMRAYINGILTIDEASEWIEEFGLKSA